jgi:hypothetical protein
MLAYPLREVYKRQKDYFGIILGSMVAADLFMFFFG